VSVSIVDDHGSEPAFAWDSIAGALKIVNGDHDWEMRASIGLALEWTRGAAIGRPFPSTDGGSMVATIQIAKSHNGIQREQGLLSPPGISFPREDSINRLMSGDVLLSPV
jgi:hypothetical protein